MTEAEELELLELEELEAQSRQPSGVLHGADQGPVTPTGEALSRGVAQGVTGGFVDEGAGWLESRFPRLGLPPGEFFDPSVPTPKAQSYTERRDDSRARDAAAEKNSAFTAGQLGGSIGTFAAAPAKVGVQAAIGGLQGLGNSSSESFGGQLFDTTLGAGLGGGLTKVGNSLAARLKDSRLADWFRGKATGAADDALRMKELAKQKAERSALGALGSKSADTIRTVEVLGEKAGQVAPELAEQGTAAINSDAVKARLTNAYQNYLQRLPRSLDDIAELEADLAAVKARDPAAEAVEYLKHPFKKEVMPRLATYATRAIPALVGQHVGGEVGGEGGRWLGGAAGLGAGIAMGNPGTAVANMLKSPAFRKMAAEAGEKLVGSGPAQVAETAGNIAGRTVPMESEDWRRRFSKLLRGDE